MMQKFNHIYITLLALLAPAAASAAIQGEWRLHPTFDNSVTKVIDTPGRVYFTGYNQTLYPAETVAFMSAPDQSLFYYDKEGDEMVAAADRHALASTLARSVDYNPDGGYLLIVYADQNIDLLYDSGEVRNISALKNASMPGSKEINGVTFVPSRNQIWLATDFGYVVLDDKKGHVVESRNYSTPLSAATRVGDLVVLTTHDHSYTAPYSSPRLSLTDYNVDTTPFAGADAIYTLAPKRILTARAVDSTDTQFGKYDVDDELALNEVWASKFNNVRSVLPSRDGYNITAFNSVITVLPEKNYNSFYKRPTADIQADIQTTATWDNKEFFGVVPRKGLYSRKLTDEEGNTQLTRDYIRPNAPAVYFSRNMAYNADYGMLVNTFGSDRVFNNTVFLVPSLLSVYRNGEWTPAGPPYTLPSQANLGQNPLGLLVDPSDPKYVYMGTSYNGLVRLNLEDPDDVLHFTNPDDPLADRPGYVNDGPTSSVWARAYTMMAPQFDRNQTMWSMLYKGDDPRLLFRYWTAADRTASKDAASARPWKTLAVDVPSNTTALTGYFIPLTSSSNKNLLLYLAQDRIVIVDHNGTPENTSDDTVRVLDRVTDQDGGAITLLGANRILEDSDSGVIWIASNSGIFYANPRNLLQGQSVINRVKVSRNDGTSLADYLLNGVSVFDIVTDPQGRKWMATEGAGIVVTSSDGKTIYDEFNSENSGLPSDIVYSLAYNPASRSMMASTSAGLTEFFLGSTGSAPSGSSEAVRAYPNPVAPDYYGWVTIDGLEEDTLVKITSASGQLIRELGRAEGGTIQWDIMDMNHRRVPSGIYYILTSPASGSGPSGVTKIMVMS